VQALYPTVFDPATGFPPGPKHWNPRADAWLGRWVTLENDADLLPDEDPTTNLDPPNDKPDMDDADDGVQFPVPTLHCQPSVFTYTVTITAGAPVARRFVNVWFDWNRDGDWADVLECPTGAPAPEWAVQNHVVTLGPGTHVLSTPLYLPWNPPGTDIPEIWMRISIAEGPAPTIPGSDRADGRGSPNGYMYGETEDYYFVPECPLPDAEFVWDPTTICTDTIVSFFDISTSTLPLLSWTWDFGDSLGTSSLQNPTYTYGTAGSYTVRLTVANVCGPDTVRHTLVVTDCPPQDPDYDIWLKDGATDDGSVPTIGAWWTSPDVWVRNDGDCTQTAHQNPVPGTTTTVCVRTRNRLTTTVDNITVRVYWASAALAITWPDSFTFLSGFGIPSLAGGAEQVQSVSWSVPYLVGHFCLRARADAPDDPIGSGPDAMLPVDHVPYNNNIAQRNTNIVDYPEVTGCGFYSTEVYTDVVYFDAVNTNNSATAVNIVFDSTDFPLGTGTLIVEPGGLWGRWSTLTNFNQAGNTLLPIGFPATMGNISMAPRETARMTMTIAAEIDERFTISVVEQKVGGADVGGIEYIRRLPICAYLPLVVKDWRP
jgi:PKD repeat protein